MLKTVMEKLFSLKWYQKFINHKQEIMIGYSDSSKDAGKLSASWHQYKLQEDILQLGKKYKINIIFFTAEAVLLGVVGVLFKPR